MTDPKDKIYKYILYKHYQKSDKYNKNQAIKL